MTGVAQIWCDADFDEPDEVSTSLGSLTLVSRRGPGKAINEDSCLLVDAGDAVLLAVADGIGGHAAGEHASREALICLAAAFPGDGAPMSVLLEAIVQANQAVIDLRLGAGTTLACALLERVGEDVTMRALHAGDSNIYLVGQRGRVGYRSLSHAPTAYGQEAGFLTEAEALFHDERHVVYNALGGAAMHVTVGPACPMAAKDTLLLCSDGLSDNLWEAEILDGARRGGMRAATQELGNLATSRMTEYQKGRPGKPDDLALMLFRRG